MPDANGFAPRTRIINVTIQPPMETAAGAQQRLVQRMRIRLDEREEGKRHAFATSLQLTFGANIDE
jgi:hypothetical protein